MNANTTLEEQNHQQLNNDYDSNSCSIYQQFYKNSHLQMRDKEAYIESLTKWMAKIDPRSTVEIMPTKP